MVTYHDLLREARAQVREVSAAEADVLRRRDGATLVDVREAAEWEQGHAAGAQFLDLRAVAAARRQDRRVAFSPQRIRRRVEVLGTPRRRSGRAAPHGRGRARRGRSQRGRHRRRRLPRGSRRRPVRADGRLASADERALERHHRVELLLGEPFSRLRDAVSCNGHRALPVRGFEHDRHVCYEPRWQASTSAI